jgi:hypothetical protein
MVIILSVLLAVAVVVAAVCAFGWFTATRPKSGPVQVKVVGSAAYTTATVTALTSTGSSSDTLDASGDNRNTYWMTTVAAGDLVTVSVGSLGMSPDPAATVGCKIFSADGVTVLSEQSGLRGMQAVCTWRNA